MKTLSVGSERTLTSKGFSREAAGDPSFSAAPARVNGAEDAKSLSPTLPGSCYTRDVPPRVLSSSGSEILCLGTSSLM